MMAMHQCVIHTANINSMYLENCIRQFANLSGGNVVIHVCNDENNMGLYRALSSIVDKEEMIKQLKNKSVLFYSNSKCADKVAKILEATEAEVVDLFFTNDSPNVFHLIEKSKQTDATPWKMIEKNQCQLAVTWVTNENQVYIYFDKLAFNKNDLFELLNIQ